MKNFKRILIAILTLVAVSAPAEAQFRFGVKVGMDINSLKLTEFKQNFSTDNRVGFTGGVMTEFLIPGVGFGFDASLMYTSRAVKIEDYLKATTYTNSYIEIPIHLKYKLSLPAVSSIVAPYIFTGPSFAFLVSKQIIDDLKNKRTDVSWNIGLGVELFRHLQVGASYGFGITKAAEYVIPEISEAKTAKTKCWTITAAWLF